MAELSDLLEALKDQFDLPAEAIGLKNQCWRGCFWWEGGENHHIIGIKQGLGLQGCTLFTGSALELFLSPGRSGLAFSDHTKSGGERGMSFQRQPDFPLSNMAGFGD